jgi:hypothetical protein
MYMTMRLAVEVSELPGVASFLVEFRFVRVHATNDDIGTMVREVDLANQPVRWNDGVRIGISEPGAVVGARSQLVECAGDPRRAGRARPDSVRPDIGEPGRLDDGR